jgi:hypothetical protein
VLETTTAIIGTELPVRLPRLARSDSRARAEWHASLSTFANQVALELGKQLAKSDKPPFIALISSPQFFVNFVAQLCNGVSRFWICFFPFFPHILNRILNDANKDFSFRNTIPLKQCFNRRKIVCG